MAKVELRVSADVDNTCGCREAGRSFKNKLVHEQKQGKTRDIEPHKLPWHHNDADKAFSTLGSDLIRSNICLRDIYFL